MADAVLHEIYSELIDQSVQAIETALAGLPDGFPVVLAESITCGYRERLRQLEN